MTTIEHTTKDALEAPPPADESAEPPDPVTLGVPEHDDSGLLRWGSQASMSSS